MVHFLKLPCVKHGDDFDILVNLDQIKYVEPSGMNGANSFMYFGGVGDENLATDTWVCVRMPFDKLTKFILEHTPPV